MSALKSHILTGIAAVGVSLAAMAWHTNSQVNNATNEILSFLSEQTQFRVVDMGKLTADMLDEGFTTTEIANYVERLVRVARAQGITLIEARDMVTFPESALITLPTPERLKAQADKLGISPTIQLDDASQSFKETVQAKR